MTVPLDEPAIDLLRSGEGGTLRVGVRIAESRVAGLVSTVLRFEGFEVDALSDDPASWRDQRQLVVAELESSVAGQLKVPNCFLDRRNDSPVLFLKPRDRMHERVLGLTIGADSFLECPFSVSEFVARVRSVLRRAGVSSSHQTFSFADLVLDEDLMRVRRGDRNIELTRTEFGLLRYLVANPSLVLSKVQILEHVWPYDFAGDTTVVETYISYLRRKVDVAGPPLIHTVRGVGYTLRLPY
jgi:two-component system, OmpR family, response regulator